MRVEVHVVRARERRSTTTRVLWTPVTFLVDLVLQPVQLPFITLWGVYAELGG